MPPSKKHRRAKGTGSIFWSASRKRYIGRVPVGRNLNGSTCYVTVSDRSEAVCAAKMRDARRPDPRQTVAEWAERWHRELTIRDSSRDDYRHTLDQFIIPTLGHLPITTLTSHQIEAAIKRWMVRLGPNTTRKNFGHLRACLEAARRAGLIPTNPAKDARRPKPRKSAIDPFTVDELDRIIQTAPPVFVLLASVGCRIGEALALDVPDLARDTGWISITKTYTRKHGIRRPKSENGIRDVRIPAQAMPAVLAAAGPRTSGPLFVTRRGVRDNQSCLWYVWKRLLLRLGLRYRRVHMLRHTYCSLALAAGVPIPNLAKAVGDSVEMLVRTYVHPVDFDVASAFELTLNGASSKRVRRPSERA